MPEPRPKRGGDKEYWVQDQKQKEVGAGYPANDDLGGGGGGDTIHFTKGHRIQCQGQNQPSRIESKLLTRATRKKGSLGGGNLPIREGRQVRRGAA